MGADAQMDVRAQQRGEFGDAQAGLNGEGQQSVIALPGPGRAVWGGEQRGGLGLGE